MSPDLFQQCSLFKIQYEVLSDPTMKSCLVCNTREQQKHLQETSSQKIEQFPKIWQISEEHGKNCLKKNFAKLV